MMINQIKHKIRMKFVKNSLEGNVLYLLLVKINTVLFHHKKKCVHKSFGEKNPDKVFFVIKSEGKEAGLMSLYWQVVRSIEYALNNGYYPIVDMKNYVNQYQVEEKNSWDIFFQQPITETLDEVYQSKNVIIQGNERLKINYDSLFSNWFDMTIDESKRSFLKKHANINTIISNMADSYLEKLEGKKLLGVFLRGTDYVALQPKGHKIQPTPDEVMSKVDEFLSQYEIDYIFLVTEDEGIRKKFEQKYLQKLLDNIGLAFGKYDKRDYLYHYISQNEIVENAKAYLKKLVILSRCEYLISSITNGSTFVTAFSEGYVASYIFDLGEYK